MSSPATKAGTKQVGNVERGTVGTFPTRRTSDQFEVLRQIGPKTEVRNKRTGWVSGVPGSTLFRPKAGEGEGK